MEVNKKIDSRN